MTKSGMAKKDTMKPTWAVLLLVFLASTVAFSQSDSETKSKVIALEKLWNQAYKSADIKALESILDDSIVLINDDGSVQTKAEFLESVRSSSAQASAQQQQVAPESFKVNVFGNIAIAAGVMRVKGVENGKAYTRRERFVDTWLKHGNGWVCIATNATPILH
jgi:ketosteroid isomerase-like protein